MKVKETIQTINYILKEVNYKYKYDFKIYISEDNIKILNFNIIDILEGNKCLNIGVNIQGNYTDYEYIYNINTLLLFDYKRKLLGKTQKSIINITTLENIAGFIGDSGNAQSIIEVLKECNIPDYLIIYPNTKWRMVYDIFKVLSTSIYEEGHRLLFSVIEAFLIPIRFSTIKDGIETQNHFSEFLSYDGFEIVKGKISPLEDKKDMYDVYYENKEGKVINSNQFKNIKDMISNTEYKQIKVKKKNGKPYVLEGSLEIIGDENKFVEIRKKYPNSEINTKNYKGKTQKYEVTEKLKFDNN